MKNKPPLAIKKMEPQRSELTALLEHFQNKQYDEAERLALALTDKFQTHPFGWKVLGAVFNKTGLTSPGNLPVLYENLINQLTYYELPTRREDRLYPRCVKSKPSKYPAKKKNASQLN